MQLFVQHHNYLLSTFYKKSTIIFGRFFGLSYHHLSLYFVGFSKYNLVTMSSLSVLLIFVFGTLVGSFINVVSLRYNTGLPISRGRSKCFSCSTKLKWYELIPILSFFSLKGKCRTCESSISWQYPVVEFLTGLLFVFIAFRQINLWHIYGSYENGLLFSIIFFIYYALVFGLLIVIGVYDFRHKIIPDGLSYSFIFLSFFKLVIFFYLCKKVFQFPVNFLDLLSPFILFVFFYFLWHYSRGKWMGFGDAKLALGIGGCLGFTYGISAIILSFWLGAIWGIFLIVMKYLNLSSKKVTMSSEIPFAPFLILATAIVFFGQIDILGIENLLGLQ